MKTFYPSINLLRGLAALFVALQHFICFNDINGSLFSSDSLIYKLGENGVNGVFIFFVISGFVIPLALLKENYKLIYLHRFLSRRFIRIEIPYIASIVLILFVSLLYSLKNNSGFSFSIERFIYHIFYIIPFTSFEWYNVIFWTLAIEFQFYILIGCLYFFISSKNRLIVILTLILFGASGFAFQDNRLVFHYSTIFLEGIILFLINLKKIKSLEGIVLILLSTIGTAYIFSTETALFSVLTLLVIQYLNINNKTVNRFGDISYSLYLTHGLIGGNLIYLLSRNLKIFSEKIFLVIAAICVSLIFAYIFWKFIENPSKLFSRKIIVAKQK